MEDSLEMALIALMVAGTLLTAHKDRQPGMWTKELDIALESISTATGLVQLKNQEVFSKAATQTRRILKNENTERSA